MCRGCPRKNFVDQLLVDTNSSNIAQLEAYMENKELWKICLDFLRDVRPKVK